MGLFGDNNSRDHRKINKTIGFTYAKAKTVFDTFGKSVSSHLYDMHSNPSKFCCNSINNTKQSQMGVSFGTKLLIDTILISETKELLAIISNRDDGILPR